MDSILEVRNLCKFFPLRHGFTDRVRKREKLMVRAVENVSINVLQNETLGLVGESGSGKTTFGRTVLMIQRPTSGEIFFQGAKISDLDGEDLRQKRKEMQIVFQNPHTSMNPRDRVRDILLEPIRAFETRGSKDANYNELVEKSLELVGLPRDCGSRLPHQFSGGQKQRIAIARALMLNPRFLVLDEPTSALDSSVQMQILNLLVSLQERLGLSYLFISHNINVVKYVSDRTAVMYAGKLVELGRTEDVLERPLHPYTIALRSAVPSPEPTEPLPVQQLHGDPPSAVNPPAGCRFNTRCRFAQTKCRENEPELREVEENHWVSCHYAEQIRENC